MRVVLDLQACQSAVSRARGIGRFGWELALAMLREPGPDEFHVVLNDALDGSAARVRGDLATLLPGDHIRTFHVPGPTAEADARNAWRAASGKLLREIFLESLAPDWVHIGSMFEGYADGALASVPTQPGAAPVAVTHHDLIPLVFPDQYLASPEARTWYFGQLEALGRARLVLTNSEFTRREAIDKLDLDPAQVVCIGCATSPQFAPLQLDGAARASLRTKHGIARPFVMYTGGADPRKNIAGLIRAFASLPGPVVNAHQLVLVGGEPAAQRDALLALARRAGLDDDALVFPGFVSDALLVELYNACSVFAFPSFHEGFGLPVLEAMACGAAVIASDTTSLPEVVDRRDALFDPHRDDAIAEAMHRVLTDAAFRAALAQHGIARARHFSWDSSARRALAAMRERTGNAPARRHAAPSRATQATAAQGSQA